MSKSLTSRPNSGNTHVGRSQFKPILFSTKMVSAIMSDDKTKTRRLMPEWCNDFGVVNIVKDPELCCAKAAEWNEIKPKQCYGLYACFDNGEEHLKSKIQVGDILWVRETYYAYGRWVKNGKTKTGKQKYKFTDFTLTSNCDFKYKYEDSKPQRIKTGRDNEIGWYKRPSLFMPKEACRNWLKVSEVNAEKLWQITNEEAVLEGVETLGYYPNYDVSSKGKFEGLWVSLNGLESWEANPFVWVYSFNRVECPQGFC